MKKEIKEEDKLMEKIVSLSKRRGFIFQGSEIYGGLAGTWDWGHFGVALKSNVKQAWWKKFVEGRTDIYGVDAAILMRQEVWKNAGHVDNFTDPMVECLICKERIRQTTEDMFSHMEKKHSDRRSGQFKKVKVEELFIATKLFNMMFKTMVGASDESSAISYLRPETAQGMFVNFKNTVDAFHPKLPFGMAQIGKAFRNEITPRDFLFRQREFEQMEIEYFVREKDWEKYFEYWKDEMIEWMEEVGIDMVKIHELEVPQEDRAHYSKRTVDFEFDYPFGKKELFGLAYRTDFDLKNHKLDFIDEEGDEGSSLKSTAKIVPHCIEPTFGVDRAVLALLLSAYREEGTGENTRVYLKLKPNIAPVICAVSPLLKNKPDLVEYAKTKVFAPLKVEFGRVMWDDNGNIGKRYRRQDEIGTPYCIVVDFDTLETDTVTVRDRDTGDQERVEVKNLLNYIKTKI